MIDRLPKTLTSSQFEQDYRPIPVKYGNTVEIMIDHPEKQYFTKHILELTKVRFANGRMAWIGYSEAKARWYWRPID